MSYWDKYGRLHHKLCTDNAEPSSNNGWIYTAYAQKYGLDLDMLSLRMCYDGCRYDYGKEFYSLCRSPAKPTPPISRDEILGMAALKVLRQNDMEGWSFCPYKVPKFNLIKLIKQLLEQRGKHRNYFWENNLDQIYRFAFSVPLTDRHFILKQWGKFNLFYWALAKVDSMIGGDSGIRWLKYDKSKEAMQKEFPEDHPLRS